MLDDEPYVFAPGLYNAGGMKLAAYAGFKAAYLSGFSYAELSLGGNEAAAAAD